MNNNVFFGEAGLTSTSANHVANLAKEYVQDIESELSNIVFYNSEVTLIGSSEYSRIGTGWSKEMLAGVKGKLDVVSGAKSLIAWLREAIKARQVMLNNIDAISIEDWARQNGIELPVEPKRDVVLDKDAIVGGWNIKERNRYYELETKCAVIGKFIHPDGAFSDARKDLNRKIASQNEVRGDGRDTLLYRYKPTCSVDEVNVAYYELQTLHRSIQAELNGMLHKVDEEIRADKVEVEGKYAKERHDYDAEMSQFISQFKIWKEGELKRVSDLKIVIPNGLKAVYDIVNALGK